MAQQTDKKTSVLRSIDWLTILFYLGLLTFGWVSVCGASYTYGETDIFSLDSRSGMQIVWIGTSIVLGLVILLLDNRFYDTFAYLIFAVLVLLLIATIFNPHTIKGSRSWLVLGPLRVQPAEFAKFATALALAKLMSTYGYDIKKWKDFAIALGFIFLPMLCIVMLLYTPTSVGKFVVLLLIQLFSGLMVFFYCGNKRDGMRVILAGLGITLIFSLFSLYVIPFDIVYVQLVTTALMIGYLLWQGVATRVRNYLWIALFAVGSIVFFNAADYVLNNVLERHQRVRINVLLGLEEDLKGAGYNVHQSQIAIGSGGIEGKGFLNGTQTKLKYVPEQDTDFIFCTVGEEEGFVGSASVLLLFLALILRLIYLSERQPYRFGRVYGYSVLSIFLFHVFINVGMVLGLTPVIGIPLPFFSYGGSSLWGFTILLFIFLRIDASRHLARS